ncbi:hypothetical protein [Methylobacterium pseudosasicola]|nr:hypothetical protein [Methylobacterium pseudosasicola]
MNDVMTQFRRKAGSKPPLSLVIGANAAMTTVWILIYTVAGRPVWLW